MRYHLVLLLSIPLFAQFPATSVSVSDTTHASVIVNWTTSSATANYLKYGLTAAYGSVSQSASSVATVHHWYISGLTADTTYHYDICGSAGSCDGVDRTFTTSALPGPHPVYPTLPTSPALPTRPTSFSTTQTITDCLNIQSAINTAAADNGNNNHLIEITASLDCGLKSGTGSGYGNGPIINLPNKSGSNPTGTGWIVVRSTGTLPPEGARITSGFYTQMPIIRIPPMAYPQASAPTVGTCTLGQLWDDFLTAGWALKSCTTPGTNTYTLLAKTDFSGAIPASCAVNNSWYYKTDEVDIDSVFWCGNSKLYRIALGGSSNYGNITTATNAHHYWIYGIRFNATPMASGGVPTYYSAYTQLFNFTGTVFDFFTNAGANNIIVESNQIDVSYPYRVRTAIFSRGTNIVIANNDVTADYHLPTLGDSTGCNSCTTQFVQMSGASGALIQNNSASVPGISIFASEDLNTGTSDVTIRGNYFTNPAKYRSGTAANTTLCGGCFFPSRHQMEVKIGSRWDINGNTFDQHFASTNNQGHLIALSPRPFGGGLPVSDIWIRNNQAWSIPNFLYVIGHNDLVGISSTYDSQAPATTRVAVTNNLVRDIDGLLYPTGGSVRQGNAVWLNMGVEDTIVLNNTFLSACTGYAPWLVAQENGPAEGLLLANNIASGCAVSAPYYYVGMISVGGGTTGLDAGWPSPTGGYSMAKNISYDAGGGLTGTGYPAGNVWPASLAAVGFYNSTANDFRLKFSSTYAPNGAGADIDAIRAATGETYGQRALSIAATTVTIGYTAPAASISCAIRIPGIADTVSTAASRFRATAITGLTSLTVYATATIYCSGSVGVVVPSFTTL